jgi:hypothetical protein
MILIVTFSRFSTVDVFVDKSKAGIGLGSFEGSANDLLVLVKANIRTFWGEPSLQQSMTSLLCSNSNLPRKVGTAPEVSQHPVQVPGYKYVRTVPYGYELIR